MTKLKDIPPSVTVLAEVGEDAFGKNVAHEDLFRHSQLEDLRELMGAAIGKKAMALVTGPPGVGKTTAVRSGCR